jgi:hypothetical protein
VPRRLHKFVADELKGKFRFDISLPSKRDPQDVDEISKSGETVNPIRRGPILSVGRGMHLVVLADVAKERNKVRGVLNALSGDGLRISYLSQ